MFASPVGAAAGRRGHRRGAAAAPRPPCRPGPRAPRRPRRTRRPGTWATRISRCRQWSNTTARSITSSPIGGHGAPLGVRRRVSVEQRRRLVRQVAHQPADERWELRQPRTGERRRDRVERLSRRRRAGPADRQRAHHLGSGRPSRPDDHDAAGSPATNEYRPHRSDRSTDSSSTPGPSPASAGNSPTGVETSASSSVQTGTSGHSAARRSNVSGSGRICRFIRVAGA